MPTRRIILEVDDIDGAAEQIIHLLEDTDKGGDIIYVHGWAGWGASAVLKEVVKRLRSSLGSGGTRTAGGLEKIIHVDFSQWQSKRALQKAIAKELELPQQVMALFDQHDEEDDFHGVEPSARGVVPHVKLAIMNELIAHRFLVVFHNGSGSYVELREVGVPLLGELSKRVLWTSKGRFWPHDTARHYEEDDVVVGSAAWLKDVSIFVGMLLSLEEYGTTMRNIHYAEIEEIAEYTGVPQPDMSPEIVTECILYRAARGYDRGISWESHASNYWVCDGIIHDATDGGGRSAWEISGALQRNMNLDFCNDCAERDTCTVLSGDRWRRIDRWVSPNTSHISKDVQVPPQATSFFWTASSAGHNGTSVLDASMFEHSDRTSILRVIHLSHCTFSFSSPPFLGCSSLRFLLLDHCKDQDLGEEMERHHRSHRIQQDGGACFRNLWVLELSYTDWYWLLSKDMLDLMADLRELNVKGVGNRSMMHLHRCSGAGSKRRSLLKLRVVADSDKDVDNGEQLSPVVVKSFPDLSSWRILKTVVLDGCGDLELIDHNALPQQSLESFTLIGSSNGVSSTSNKIKSISFRGCAKLKSLQLRGVFGSLVELDMSGTSIKTLDLGATQAMGLRRLFLLGCEELRAILWPQVEDKNNVQLEVLRIDTTTKQQEATASDNNAIIRCGKDRRTSIDLDWYISIRDPRFFCSLVNLRHPYDFGLHVEISSAGGHKDTASQGIYSMWLWQCPPIRKSYPRKWSYCYISIQDEETRAESLQGASTTNTIITGTGQLASATTLPYFVQVYARALHLHDNLFITSLPGPTHGTGTFKWTWPWEALQWCRIERCPNLEGVVFTAPPSFLKSEDERDIFWNLETFWASQLPKARSIWDWSTSGFRPQELSFDELVFLHLDNCPRLVHVLPLFTSNTDGCYCLETLEIVCCGDLKEVFPSDLESQEQERQRREFPRLKYIHLYELPKLRRICGHYGILAPRLRTVKVRGCWGLKRLPAIGRRRSTAPVVDCEKDWWDSLEWDGEEAGHHASHYEPTFSAYYKMKQLRASALR